MDRTQCVYANGQFSGFLPVVQGVLQGSILGPLLFSKYHIYADDVQLYLSCHCDENIESVVNQINTDLTSIAEKLKKLKSWQYIDINPHFYHG
jgi:hypothetical protein